MRALPRRMLVIPVTIFALAPLLGASCGDLFRRQPRKSQPALVEQRMGRTEITVRYNRPVARGRTLFGGIVKYGEVWDRGADEATTIQVSGDVLFGATRSRSLRAATPCGPYRGPTSGRSS